MIQPTCKKANIAEFFLIKPRAYASCFQFNGRVKKKLLSMIYILVYSLTCIFRNEFVHSFTVTLILIVVSRSYFASTRAVNSLTASLQRSPELHSRNKLYSVSDVYTPALLTEVSAVQFKYV